MRVCEAVMTELAKDSRFCECVLNQNGKFQVYICYPHKAYIYIYQSPVRIHWNSTRPLKNWSVGKTSITKVPFAKSNHDPTQYWQDETTPMHKWLESKWDLEFEHSKTLCKKKAHHEFSPQGAAPPKVCWDTILGAHWQGTRRAMRCHDVFWAPLKCRRFTAGRATDLILHDESLQPCPTQFLPKCAWMCFQIFSDRFHVWLVVFVSHTAKFYGNHFASLLFMSTLEFAVFALW